MEKMIQFFKAMTSGNRTHVHLKKVSLGVLFLMLIGYAPGLTAQDTMTHGESAEVLVYELEDVEWKDGPASLEAGAQVAVLEGNPAEEGYFNLRLKLPDGFMISPHWHPKFERITVISGNFLLGHGDSADKNTTQRLGPGSYASLPKEMVHYAIAEGETVIQLATLGPWEINYVREEDDPRKREK